MCYQYIEEHDLNQSRVNFLVEWVAKYNGENNGINQKINKFLEKTALLSFFNFGYANKAYPKSTQFSSG